MTAIEAPLQACGECCRSMAKAKKVHRGKRYCETCYARLFKRRACAGCGNFARLPIFHSGAKCRACELNEPCVRCKRPGRPVGMLTPYGPACNSCAHYFRTPEPCDICGEHSTRLTRVQKTGSGARCCPRCVRSEAATCPSCRRHRVLIPQGEAPACCRACAEQGEVPCQRCGEAMPAGYGKTCESCYWKSSLLQRLAIKQEAFEQPHTRSLFVEFVQWLETHAGAHRASLKIGRYHPFFEFIERYPMEIPSYADLVEHFQAQGLRQFRTPMKWLKERYSVHADPALQVQVTESRRIEALLGKPVPGPARTLLHSYHAGMMARLAAGTVALRSIRISLKAAVSLLEEASASFGKIPDQPDLRRYLLKKPGQRAAVQGFVLHVNQTHGLTLSTDVGDKAVSRARRKHLEMQLIGMMGSGESGEQFERNWIKAALMLFHDLARPNKRKLSYERQVIDSQEGFAVRSGSKNYWVPAPLRR